MSAHPEFRMTVDSGVQANETRDATPLRYGEYRHRDRFVHPEAVVRGRLVEPLTSSGWSGRSLNTTRWRQRRWS